MRLDPYEMVAPLGASGMGEVYGARDEKLNRDVAIKVLLAAVAHDPDRLARFSREAQLLASLNRHSGGLRARRGRQSRVAADMHADGVQARWPIADHSGRACAHTAAAAPIARRAESQACALGRCYDISSDGQQFLLRDRSVTSRLTVSRMDLILNWTATLGKGR
jgi:serine/threonine protein kinase